MSIQHTESGIPVLTEVIKTPVYGVDVPERRAQVPPPPMPAQAPSRTTTAPATAGFEPAYPMPLTPSAEVLPGQPVPDAVAYPTADAEEMRRDITERVLTQLMDHVDAVLEQRIRGSLADVLQTAVDGLASQLRDGLKETLEKVLTTAVRQEMENSRLPKNKNF